MFDVATCVSDPVSDEKKCYEFALTVCSNEWTQTPSTQNDFFSSNTRINLADKTWTSVEMLKKKFNLYIGTE